MMDGKDLLCLHMHLSASEKRAENSWPEFCGLVLLILLRGLSGPSIMSVSIMNILADLKVASEQSQFRMSRLNSKRRSPFGIRKTDTELKN